MKVTPGYVFGVRDPITTAKANLLGQPAVTLEDGEITEAKLSPAMQAQIDRLTALPGKNLLCNGDFHMWPYDDELAQGAFVAGVVSGGRKHEARGNAARWAIANDANRVASRVAFTPGPPDPTVPTSSKYFLHWAQSAPLASINPAYLGQRLEGVEVLAANTVTFIIWVRAGAAFTVTPVLRQYFGSGGSTEVLTQGTAVLLATNVWTRIVQKFDIPSIVGKTVGLMPFTEFRVEVPQGIAFALDFAQAMVVMGPTPTGWDPRLSHEDYLYASRYFQIIGIELSNNISIWCPFVNLRIPLANLSPTLTLQPISGAGGTIGIGSVYKTMLIQASNHSAIVGAYVIVDGELQAPA